MHNKILKFLKKRILLIIIIILVISNIFFITQSIKETPTPETEEFVFYQKCTEMNYKEKKKYYKKIDYKKFKKLYKQNKINNIAIVDSSSPTYKSYLTLLNHIAYYKGTNLFVLDINELSTKNSVEFYEIDERLLNLEGDYMISTKKKKVISITEIEPSEIGSLIKEMEQ